MRPLVLFARFARLRYACAFCLLGLLMAAGCVSPTQYYPPTPTALPSAQIQFEEVATADNWGDDEDMHVFLFRDVDGLAAAAPRLSQGFQNTVLPYLTSLGPDQALVALGGHNAEGLPPIITQQVFLDNDHLIVYAQFCKSRLAPSVEGWFYQVVRITLPPDGVPDELTPKLVTFEGYCS